MRLKPGRPDLSRYRDRFDVPEAKGARRVTFLGVSTLVLDDGESAIMTDGFFSRPGLLSVAARKITPDRERVAAGLRLGGVDRLDAVVPVHAHFDHVMDSPLVAELTGARLAGDESALQVGVGHALPADRRDLLVEGAPVTYGSWTLTPFTGHHCPPDRYPGEITQPVIPPVKVGAYRCGRAWSLHVAHRGGDTALIVGSAGYVAGALAGVRADIAYLGVGQLGLLDEDYIETYWTETVRAVGARRVVLIHWDDFFRPLDQPLRALPYAGDDLDVSIRVIDRLAAADGVTVHLPRLGVREDPWA